MLTVHDDLEQGSDEWLAARRGIVTASVVGNLITVGPPSPSTITCPTCGAQAYDQCFSQARKTPTPIKTAHSGRIDAAAALPPVIAPANNDTSRGLTAVLVAERITGRSETSFTNNDMLRGILCEPVARDAYSKYHAPVAEVGFMRLDGDGWTLGCSPDGLVGDDGMIEIKSPRAKAHVRTILANAVPAQYVAQCQAALLVSGRSWLDFVSFHGGLPLYTKRVYPDPAWHAAIKTACQQFEQTARQMVDDYERTVVDLPPTEWIDTDLDVVI